MSGLFIHHASLLSFHNGFASGNDSMLIENGRIKAVGKYDQLRMMVHPGIPQLDAGGKTIMPGFNDSHIHIWKVGNLKTFMLDLRPATSLDHMLSLLSDYHQRFPDVPWITARGFNEGSWNTAVFPTKTDLDRVSRQKPIQVMHTSAHTVVVNSRALERASINSDSVVPEGGEMVLGPDGKPNGIFSETAMGMITRYIPPYSKKQLKIMIGTAREEMYRYGITAATDPAVDPTLLEAYRELEQEGLLGFRLNAIPILLPDGEDQPFHIPDLFSSGFLQINMVKFFSDGGLSNKTAALKRPYRNSTSQGILRLNKDLYLSLCRSAMIRGFGIATHAIGDRAIDFVIEQYKTLHSSFPGLIKRIEHLGLPDKKNLDDMFEYQIATSMQAIFIHELGQNFIRSLDEEYLGTCYPLNSVIQRGILTAISSDAPVVQDFNPLKGIETAVTRRDRNGNTIAPGEAISVEAALKAYTLDAARISGMKDYGVLKEGAVADFILLDENPLVCSADQLHRIKVQKTFISGNMVWDADRKMP